MPATSLPRYLSGIACGLALGCQSPAATPTAEPGASAAAAAVTASVSGEAKLGAAAPDFTLPDLDGKPVKLSSFAGKVVVLEWFNPQCPFVRASHTVGSLRGTAARHAKEDVVWLGVNSGAPGKQGHDPAVNRSAASEWGLGHPILKDPTGVVGKAYGAVRTPHVYVIDAKGVLVYAGAIDNSPDGEGQSPKDGKLVNYVDEALQDLAAGRPVRTPSTEAYGCGVKYGS